MFCNNCGAQVPDGMKFCTSCGTQLPVSANSENASFNNNYYNPPFPPVTPQQSAAPAPKAPKNNNNTLIIAIVAAILVVAIAITAVILVVNSKKNNEEDAEDSTASTSVSTLAEKTGKEDKEDKTDKTERTKETEPTKPENDNIPSSGNIDEALDQSADYIDSFLWFDVEDVAYIEILGIDDFYDVFEDTLLDYSGLDDLDEVYESLSESTGEYITDSTDALYALFSSEMIEEAYEEEFGADFEIEINDAKAEYISVSDAEKYIQKTQEILEDYSYAYIDPDILDADDFESFAKADLDITISGSESNQSTTFSVVLGYDGVDWYVLYAEDEDFSYGLFSIYLLELAFD